MTPRRIAWVATVGFVALVALIVAVDRVEDWMTSVHYPLDVWRMDLDDLLANVGLFLAGLAAYLKVRRSTPGVEKKVETVEGQVNGEIRELAAELIRDEIATAGLSQTTVEMEGRVEALEVQRDQCLTELAAMRAAIRQIGDT